MKILSIRFQNLNSLKGDWLINFDVSPLSDVGIFAITGPTGGGKTTILDALTLGLYGKTPRLEQAPAEHIITKQTGDAYSEVTFAVKDKVYCAKWSAKRARKHWQGRVQTPKMELLELAGPDWHLEKLTDSDWVVIEDRYKYVPGVVAELSGLDFERFKRSIVLAQGDFAAFLNSNDNNRAELLEKITGTEIYASISRAAYEKAKEEDQKLRELENLIDNIQLMPDEELKSLETSIEKITVQIEQIQVEINSLRECETWLTDIANLETEKQKCMADLDIANKEQQTMQGDIVRIAVFEKILPHRGRLDVLEEKKKQAQLITIKIGDLNRTLPGLKKEFNDLSDQKKLLQQEVDSAKKQKADNEQLIDRVISKDKDIANQKKLCFNAEEILKKLKIQQNDFIGRKKENEAEIVKIQDEFEKLEKGLEENKGDKHLPKDIPLVNDRLQFIIEVRAKIEKLNQNLLVVTERLKDYEQSIPIKDKEVRKKKDHIVLLQQSLNENERQIHDALLGAESIEAIEEEEHLLSDLASLYERLLPISTEYCKCLIEELENTKTQEELTQRHGEIQKTIETILEEKSLQEQLIQTLDRAVKNEMLIANYEEARKSLVENEPCPLCGSLHHPYVTGKHLVKTDSQHALYEQKAKLNELVKTLDAQNRLKIEAETQLKECDKKRGQINKHKQELLRKWDTESATLSEPAQIQNEAELAQKQQSCKNLLNEKRRIAKNVKKVKKVFDKVNQQVTNESNKLVELRQDIQVLKLKQQQDQNEALRIADEIMDMQKTEFQSCQLLQQRLTLYNEQLPGKGLENHLIERLQARSTAYIKTLNSIEQHRDSLQKLQAKAQSLDASITTLLDQVNIREQDFLEAQQELARVEIQRHELFGTKNPVEEKKKMEKAVLHAENSLQNVVESLTSAQNAFDFNTNSLRKTETDLQEVKKEISELETTFSELLIELNVPSIEDFKEALLSQGEYQKIAKKREEIQKRIIQSETLLKQFLEKAQRERAKQLTDETIETVKTRLNEKVKSLEELQKTLFRNQFSLEQQKEQKKKYAEVQQALRQQRSECRKWGLLRGLIGSHDGKEFRKFAQGLTLERLLWLANRHLSKLHERYYLVKKEGNDLAFEVVDTYQTDLRRPTTTLSGGESFLVSLALALGLSDLASKNTKIDSFFLDEGFGTLDTETLESALTTLENLQATGKVIGVISHVEALKERISTQIQIEKFSGGVSRIKIVG